MALKETPAVGHDIQREMFAPRAMRGTSGVPVLPKALWTNTRGAAKDAVEGFDASETGSRGDTIRGQVGFEKQPFGSLQSALRDLRVDRPTEGTREPPLERSSRHARLLDHIRNTDGSSGIVLDKP